MGGKHDAVDAVLVEWHIETKREFWAEMDDILHLPRRPNLSDLDNALLTFIKFCSIYHDEYLGTIQLLNVAMDLILTSELFKFHSMRMVELALKQIRRSKNPHTIYIVLTMLLSEGERVPATFRSLEKWRRVMPYLMRWIEGEDLAVEVHRSSGDIEVRVRIRATVLIYEVCRVQKLETVDLEFFTEEFIEHIFKLVEYTRLMDDETQNYALIKLIVALNEQFMVASLPPSSHHHKSKGSGDIKHQHHTAAPQSASSTTELADKESVESKKSNRVLEVLIRRLGSSKTFGENMIFMLNRAENSPEGLCIQLLILKILYLLFTTTGTQEYFYTNDLKVLVDVFIRELGNLPEESEALRHTYLRVLHPLLTNTQLKETPYKRPALRLLLLSLLSNSHIRDITSTTRRLVERCLSGDWCGEGKLATVPEKMDTLEKLGMTDIDAGRIAELERIAAKQEKKEGLLAANSAVELPEHILPSMKGLNLSAPTPNGSVLSLNSVAGAKPSAARKATGGSDYMTDGEVMPSRTVMELREEGGGISPSRQDSLNEVANGKTMYQHPRVVVSRASNGTDHDSDDTKINRPTFYTRRSSNPDYSTSKLEYDHHHSHRSPHHHHMNGHHSDIHRLASSSTGDLSSLPHSAPSTPPQSHPSPKQRRKPPAPPVRTPKLPSTSPYSSYGSDGDSLLSVSAPKNWTTFNC